MERSILGSIIKTQSSMLNSGLGEEFTTNDAALRPLEHAHTQTMESSTVENCSILYLQVSYLPQASTNESRATIEIKRGISAGKSLAELAFHR